MKFMLPVRAFWPLPPRPAVLPVPLAWPRPTRFFSFTPPPGGGVSLVSSFISSLRGSPRSLGLQGLHCRTASTLLSLCSFRAGRLLRLGQGAAAEGLEGLVGLRPFDQVRDLVDHAADRRGVLQDALA